MSTILVFTGSSAHDSDGQAVATRLLTNLAERGSRCVIADTTGSLRGYSATTWLAAETHTIGPHPSDAADFARAYNQEHHVDAVLTLWEDTSDHAAAAASALNLPGNSPMAVELCCSPARLRGFLASAGFLQLPPRSHGDREKTGDRQSVYATGLFLSDRPHVLALVGEVTSPSGDVIGYHLPARLDAETTYNVAAAVESALVTLGLRHGLFQVRCVLTPRGAVVCEVGLGMGPGRLLSMLDWSFEDFDLIDAFCTDGLGLPVNLPPKRPQPAVARSLGADQALAMSGSDLRSDSGVVALVPNPVGPLGLAHGAGAIVGVGGDDHGSASACHARPARPAAADDAIDMPTSHSVSPGASPTAQ